MTQEATMIALDNSNYMKNGDFIPDRFLAQREAIYFICNSLKRQNAENTCGLITLSSSQVLCTLTMDTSKIYSKACQINPDGEISFCTTISIAHLALRNRQYRNQKPKILIFLGSPVEDSEEEMFKIARKLKKEKVSVVIVNFGESSTNEIKLNEFINSINGKDSTSSQIITVPSGNGIVEYLRSNPIITGDKQGTERPTNDYGIDILEDPDLAYALRVSLEDQRMRINEPEPANPSVPTQPHLTTVDEHQLTMSVLDAAAAQLERISEREQSIDFQEMTEEEQIQYAINISMAAQQQNIGSDSTTDKKTIKKRHSADSKNGSKSEKSRRPT